MKLFILAERRYKINTHKLTILREDLNLSVEQFANVIGWSPSYQCQLEAGKYITVSEKTMEEICATFFRYNIETSSLL